MKVTCDELPKLAGQQLGQTGWRQISQVDVDAFADATGDRQWIHTDPERASAGPFGRPIAHGYLTMSLAPVLLGEVLDVTDASLIVNYGADRVRFPAPLPVGRRVRADIACLDAQELDGAVQIKLKVTCEVDGQDKPCCVAEILFRYYRPR
jgi:acyl dehydratase